MLGGRVRVRDDRPAGPHGPAAPGEHGRADHDGQRRRPVRAQHPQRPGVDPPWGGLPRGQQLDAASLRRAGHRAAGEEGADHVHRVDAGPCRARDRGDELVDARVALHRHEGGHLHGAGLAHPGEVVAQQVHDHEVLGARLGVGGERAGGLGVLGRVGQSGGRALDRLGAVPPVPSGEEALGGGGDHGPPAGARAVLQQRRIRGRLVRGELVEEDQRVHAQPGIGVEAGGQAQLVGVAGVQRGAAAGDLLGVRRPVLAPRARRLLIGPWFRDGVLLRGYDGVARRRLEGAAGRGEGAAHVHCPAVGAGLRGGRIEGDDAAVQHPGRVVRHDVAGRAHPELRGQGRGVPGAG